MPPSYPATLDFLYNLQKHGIKLGLDTIRALLERSGDPQTRYQTIHIGGTNGKGSTAAMVASVLQTAGYRVGLYTSPHLVDFRERMCVDGVLISEQAVVELTKRLRTLAGFDLTPTFFEFTTAMALQYFADLNADLAVVEVGMGGRFDATNILEPFVTGITTVALDHQNHLGSTLEAIAFEKAGIIKFGVPVVVGRLGQEASAVVQRIAGERAAPSYHLESDFRFEGNSPSRFHYFGLSHSYLNLGCPLEGIHQLDNAACAIAMVELAGTRGLSISESAVREGLGSLSWEGRLEIAETDPVLLLDGAHNPAAAQVVARYVGLFRETHPGSRIVLLVGMMRDKDLEGFLSIVLPRGDEVILTEPNLPRAATVRELCAAMSPRSQAVHLAPVLADALATARGLARPQDLICVTGSLMLVGEIKALLRGSDLSPIRG